jgi:flagellar biosynthesis protein FliQ
VALTLIAFGGWMLATIVAFGAQAIRNIPVYF